MTLNVTNIITRVNELAAAGNLTTEQTAQIQYIIDNWDNIPGVSVATEAQLPTAAENAGRFIYVEDTGEFVISDGVAWGYFTYPVVVENKLWTWGYNYKGQLGDNTATSRLSPITTAGGGTNWSQVSAGRLHTAAIKTDGTLWTWGYNSYGQLGNMMFDDKSSPITPSNSSTTWKQVSAGDNHTAAIKTDGTLWVWGANVSGEVGNNNTILQSSPSTTAGGGNTWSQVSAGSVFTAAVKTDGTLWTWGNNQFGKLGIDDTVNRSSPVTIAGGGTTWKQVSAGSRHAAAIKTDGTLWLWGINNNGHLGDDTNVSKLSPITTAGGGTDWSQVSAGGYHTAAIKTDGTLWTWVNNTYGRLGDNTTTTRSSPITTAGGGTNWKEVSTGVYGSHTAAVKTDGTLWTWGYNASGRLGTGNYTSRSSPGTTAGGGTNWSQVSAGADFTAAINIPIYYNGQLT